MDINDDYTSAVTEFLNTYYDENPQDNTYTGILSRYSGLRKDDVVAILDYMDYMDYVANYKPEERLAFGDETVLEEANRYEIIKGEKNTNIYAFILKQEKQQYSKCKINIATA